MTRLASWLLAALVLCGLAFVAATAGALPPRVATHFGAGGMANGWMAREGYVAFALLLQLVLPVMLFLGVGWLPGRLGRFTNLPHREYWLAPPQRPVTLGWLRGLGATMGCAMALLASGLHAAILDANARTPPRLDEPLFLAGLVAFGVVIVGCVIAMHRRFRRAPREG
ncbi:MAG TPA: DUF1648 domain-containing protein [Casimicrobiaceae bacterium]|nr:DUF1648 domain-containing protein [Casimicrobiaceae bacterium]